MLPMSIARPPYNPEDEPVEADPDDVPLERAHDPAGGGSWLFVVLLGDVLLEGAPLEGALLLRGDLPSSRMPQSVSDAVAPDPKTSNINPPATRSISLPPHAQRRV